MSLSWELKKIANYKSLCWIEITAENTRGPEGGDTIGHFRLNPVTECLIWRGDALGLGSITDKNVNKYIARNAVYQALVGPALHRGDGASFYITADDIRAHIGLATNWGTMPSRRAWVNRVLVGNVKQPHLVRAVQAMVDDLVRRQAAHNMQQPPTPPREVSNG